MVPHNLPSPPAEDTKATLSRKNASSSTKAPKPVHRVAKRTGSTANMKHHHDHASHSSGMDGRHKRVWKACERCRVKKTKCDGEFPCKRCRDDGQACTAGVRKKMEYKQLPRGYAEVLENTQFVLVATVHKLYSMVRNSQQWDLSEPELNDRGQPVIHNIAQKLGCIRPNSGIDPLVPSVFPEDKRGMQEVAFQLEEQQRHEAKATKAMKGIDPSNYQRNDRTRCASSSGLEYSDLWPDPKAAQYSRDCANATSYGSDTMTVSTRGFTTSNGDFEMSQPPLELESQAILPIASPIVNNFPGWSPMVNRPPGGPNTMPLATSPVSLIEPQSHMVLNQGLCESEFGFIKPCVLNCPDPEVMLGMGNPMVYAGLIPTIFTGYTWPQYIGANEEEDKKT